MHAAVERSGSGGGGRAWYLKDPHMQRGQGVVVFVYGDGDGWAEVWLIHVALAAVSYCSLPVCITRGANVHLITRLGCLSRLSGCCRGARRSLYFRPA